MLGVTPQEYGSQEPLGPGELRQVTQLTGLRDPPGVANSAVSSCAESRRELFRIGVRR